MAEPRAPHQSPNLGPGPVVPEPPPPPDLRALLTALVNAEDPARQALAARELFTDPAVYQRIVDARVTGLALRAAEHLHPAQRLTAGARLLQRPQACEDILQSGDAEELRAGLNIAHQLTDHWDLAPIGQAAIGQLLTPAGCAIAAASTPRVIDTAWRAADQLPEVKDGADDRTPLAQEVRAQLSAPRALLAETRDYRDVLAGVAPGAGAAPGPTRRPPGGGGAAL